MEELCQGNSILTLRGGSAGGGGGSCRGSAGKIDVTLVPAVLPVFFTNYELYNIKNATKCNR